MAPTERLPPLHTGIEIDTVTETCSLEYQMMMSAQKPSNL
jgi:hypothetical protein